MKKLKDLKIIKRDSREVNFNVQNICNAITKAKDYTKENVDVQQVVSIVLQKLIALGKEKYHVEEIQDIVEECLINKGYQKTHKAYIIYREERRKARDIHIKELYETLDDPNGNDTQNENANMSAFTPSGMMGKYASDLGNKVASDYLIKPEYAQAHKEGWAHIHDRDWYSSHSLTCLEGGTHITLKDKKGKIINTTISFLDELFQQKDNQTPEWVDVNNYHILGRNGWTLLEKAMRRKMVKGETIYNLKTRKGLGLRVTGNHKIPVIRQGVEQLLSVKDIKIGDELLTNPNIDFNPKDTINLIDEFIDSEYEEDLMVCNIDPLRKWLAYKYNIDTKKQFAELIGSTTSKMGVTYITIQQLHNIMENYIIPYEVLMTISVKMKFGKTVLPIFLPITPELAKVFGYIFSDGSVCYHKESGSYQLTFVNHDKNKNEHFKKCLNTVGISHFYDRYTEGRITGVTLADKLMTTLVGRVLGWKVNSGDIKIPNFIFNSSDEIKYSFISALIDGDGNITDSRNIRYTTVCNEFAQQIVLLLKSLGIEATIKTKATKGTVAKFKEKISIRNYDTNTLTISGKENLRKLLSNLNGIKRNQQMLDYASTGTTIKYSSKRIEDIIEMQDDIYVYDLQTSEHWFIANDYVVHNCLHHPMDRLTENGLKAGHNSMRPCKSIESASIMCCISLQTVQNEMHR